MKDNNPVSLSVAKRPRLEPQAGGILSKDAYEFCHELLKKIPRPSAKGGYHIVDFTDPSEESADF